MVQSGVGLEALAPREPSKPKRGVFGVLARLPTRLAFAGAAAVGRRRFRRALPALGDAIADVAPVLQLSAERVAQVARRSFEHAACDRLEYALFERLTAARLTRYLEIQGLDHLHGALELGRGAILYSGHVRGHYLFFSALGLQGLAPNIVGMPIDPDGSPASRAVFERNEHLLRERFGCRFLFMAGDDFAVAARAANALRRNEVVTMEIDHTHSTSNIEATFLGRRGRFPVGPLLLARSSGAPMLPFWLYRPSRHSPQRAVVGEAIFVRDDLEVALRQCLLPLEEQIRGHPESWATWLFPERRVWMSA